MFIKIGNAIIFQAISVYFEIPMFEISRVDFISKLSFQLTLS